MGNENGWGNNPLGNIKMTKLKIDLPQNSAPDMSHIQRYNEQIREEKKREIEEKMHKEEAEKQYRDQTLQLLSGIERNTAVLQQISFLMRKSNVKQEETFALIVEILEIMKSETNEEVVSKYQKIMNKISQFTDDVETMQSLYSISGTIYSVVSNMIT
ncbi:hypothetical protein [Bacillus atrophaeus]|uniref:hypothetical protein n=1 Tax=Bacillus atrophaeus TaxID=1452 RepID=UPI001BA44CCE|nr:hypothetical protein [Bacillus atrophaeus]QUF66013.1 hypothetical protein KCX77_03435 [Bacillus atrophaeus]QUF66066.1 hypothetical protein KCX77_03735 [Bacillus atrophaeus]